MFLIKVNAFGWFFQNHPILNQIRQKILKRRIENLKRLLPPSALAPQPQPPSSSATVQPAAEAPPPVRLPAAAPQPVPVPQPVLPQPKPVIPVTPQKTVSSNDYDYIGFDSTEISLIKLFGGPAKFAAAVEANGGKIPVPP